MSINETFMTRGIFMEYRKIIIDSKKISSHFLSYIPWIIPQLIPILVVSQADRN